MSTTTNPDARPELPVGATLDRGFGLLRRNLRPLLLPQLVLYAVALVALVVLGVVAFLLIGDVATHTEMVRESTLFGDSTLVAEDVADFTDGQVVILALFGAVALLIYLWVSVAATASVVRAAERALTDEERLPVGVAARRAMADAPRLLGLGVVFVLGVLVVLAVAAGIVVALASVSSSLALLSGLVVLAGLVYLGVRVFLWPIVTVAEGRGLGSFGRAWSLTRQRFWALFALLALTTIVVSVVYVIASALLAAVVGGIAAIDEVLGVIALVPYFVLAVVFSLATTAGILAPLVVAHRVLAGVDEPPVSTGGPVQPSGLAATEAGDPRTASSGRGSSPWDAAESGLWAGRRD